MNDTRAYTKFIADTEIAAFVAGDHKQPQVTSPDIYYIILDAYGRSDVLRELYGHENEPFLNELRQRGFCIATASRSNYHLTELSLASSLNMTHLANLKLDRFATRLPVRRMIQESQVARSLKQRGYHTIAFASGKADTECRGYDQFVSPSPALNVYQDTLLHTTAIPRLLQLAPAVLPRLPIGIGAGFPKHSTQSATRRKFPHNRHLSLHT